MKSIRTTDTDDNRNSKRLRLTRPIEAEIRHAIIYHSENNFNILEKNLLIEKYQLTIETTYYLLSQVENLIKHHNEYTTSACVKRIISTSIHRLHELFCSPILNENQTKYLQEKSRSIISILCYLAKADFNFPVLSKEFIQHLETCFDQSGYPNSASIMLYTLGILAKYDRINHSISIIRVEHLLECTSKANDENISFHIFSAIYGIALLAKENKLIGVIKSDGINTLLNQFNRGEKKLNYHITLMIFSLGLLADADKLNKQSLDQKYFKELINSLTNLSLTKSECEQTLSGLSRIIRYHDNTLIKHIPSKLVNKLASLLSNFMYLYPVTAVNLIDMLSAFTPYAKELDIIYNKLIKAITVPLTRLPHDSQIKLINCLHLLEKQNKHWYNKLHSHLYPTSKPSTIVIRQFIDNSIKHKKNNKITSNPTVSNNSHSSTTCKNQIYKLINEGRVLQLKILLNVKESNPKQPISLRTAHQESEIDKLFHQKKSHHIHEYPFESLVRNFFKETDAETLENLIKKSNHVYFDLLLNACSMHTRYQLITHRILHPIILHLAFDELNLLIDKLISPMQIYRDHYAVISLIGALVIRSETTDISNNDAIEKLAGKLMEKSLAYHQSCAHFNVVSRLKRINFRNFVLTNENDEEIDRNEEKRLNFC